MKGERRKGRRCSQLFVCVPEGAWQAALWRRKGRSPHGCLLWVRLSFSCLLLSREICLVSLIRPIWQLRKVRADVSCPSSCSCRMAEQESVPGSCCPKAGALGTLHSGSQGGAWPLSSPSLRPWRVLPLFLEAGWLLLLCDLGHII